MSDGEPATAQRLRAIRRSQVRSIALSSRQFDTVRDTPFHSTQTDRPDSLHVDRFPSLKARRLLSILTGSPLGYTIVRQNGSHRRLEADGRPPVTFAFHDRATIPGGMVRKVLVDQVGLSEAEARDLI